MKTISVLGLGLVVLLAVWDGSVRSKQCAPSRSDLVFRVADNERPVSRLGQRIEPKESDSENLLALVETETEPERRSRALDRVLGSVSDADVSERLTSLLNVEGATVAEFRKLLLRRWAEKDPASAAEWAAQLQLSGGAEFLPLLKQVALAWANKDLISASTWVRKLPEGSDRLAVTMEVAYEAARTNPVAALELATALPQSRARDNLLVHSVSQWVVSDSEAANIWVAKVPDQSLRDRLVSAMATASAERDGPAAASLAISGISSREEQERAAILIVQRWSQESPEAVASWVSQFQDSPLRDVAVENLLTLWTIRNPEAAEAWLRDLPVGSLRDTAVAADIHALGSRAGM